MRQVVRGASASLRYRFLEDETPVEVDTVTYGVTDDLDREVVAPGTAAAVIDDEPTGWVKATLPADKLAEVGPLTVTWTANPGEGETVRIDTLEVVGGFYFDLAELRAMPDISDDTDRYTTAKLIRAREWVEERIDGVCRTSFVERFRSEQQTSDAWRGGGVFTSDEWPRRILSLGLDGALISDPELAGLQVITGPMGGVAPATNPVVQFPSSLWTVATLRYVAGYSATPPADLRVAALEAARNRLLTVDGESGIPDRATSIRSGDATIDLQMADADDHPTGWHDIDAVIVSWRDRVRDTAGAV